MADRGSGNAQAQAQAAAAQGAQAEYKKKMVDTEGKDLGSAALSSRQVTLTPPDNQDQRVGYAEGGPVDMPNSGEDIALDDVDPELIELIAQLVQEGYSEDEIVNAIMQAEDEGWDNEMPGEDEDGPAILPNMNFDFEVPAFSDGRKEEEKWRKKGGPEKKAAYQESKKNDKEVSDEDTKKPSDCKGGFSDESKGGKNVTARKDSAKSEKKEGYSSGGYVEKPKNRLASLIGSLGRYN